MKDNPAYLDELERQAAQLQRRRPEWPVEFTRGPDERDKTAAWIQVLLGDVGCQITLWTSGECDWELIRQDGEIVAQTQELRTVAEVESTVDDWIATCDREWNLAPDA